MSLFQGDIFRAMRYPLIFQIVVSRCILISYTFKKLLNIGVDSVYLKHLMKKELAIFIEQDRIFMFKTNNFQKYFRRFEEARNYKIAWKLVQTTAELVERRSAKLNMSLRIPHRSTRSSLLTLRV